MAQRFKSLCVLSSPQDETMRHPGIVFSLAHDSSKRSGWPTKWRRMAIDWAVGWWGGCVGWLAVWLSGGCICLSAKILMMLRCLAYHHCASVDFNETGAWSVESGTWHGQFAENFLQPLLKIRGVYYFWLLARAWKRSPSVSLVPLLSNKLIARVQISFFLLASISVYFLCVSPFEQVLCLLLNDSFLERPRDNWSFCPSP